MYVTCTWRCSSSGISGRIRIGANSLTHIQVVVSMTVLRVCTSNCSSTVVQPAVGAGT